MPSDLIRDEFLYATAERIHLLCENAHRRLRHSVGEERDASFRAHIEDIVRHLERCQRHNNGLIEK